MAWRGGIATSFALGGSRGDAEARRTAARTTTAAATATAVSRTQINLAWSDNSDEDNFWVIRCTGTLEFCRNGSYTASFSVERNITTFSDTSVQPNTTYTYRILAYRARYSEPSNEASATTPP